MDDSETSSLRLNQVRLVSLPTQFDILPLVEPILFEKRERIVESASRMSTGGKGVTLATGGGRGCST